MNGIESLLDTNVVIGLLKQNEAATALVKGLEFDQIAISQITRMELLGYPNLPNQEEQKIQAFLKNCHVLLIDESVEQRTIQIQPRWKLQIARCHHCCHSTSASSEPAYP